MNRVSAACLGSQLPGLSLRVSQPTVAWVWPASRDQLLGLVSVPSMNLEAYRTDTGVHQMWVWILPLTLTNRATLGKDISSCGACCVVWKGGRRAVGGWVS